MGTAQRCVLVMAGRCVTCRVQVHGRHSIGLSVGLIATAVHVVWGDLATVDVIQLRIRQNAGLVGYLLRHCTSSCCGVAGVAAPRCALERAVTHLAAVIVAFLKLAGSNQLPNGR
jgi:hypothetical protein